MKTKHTFVFTFVLGLIWTGYLFAFSTGPDPGVNGVLGPTCNQSGCHTSFPVNNGGVQVAISGLPASWTPGQTYALTVTVSRAAARYGFQLSAVNNATNVQAGALLAASPNDNRVSIITGGGRQYAQHNPLPNTTGTFNLRWTAPASASFGAVRFNVAANASNNDNTSSGDFIFTASSVVSAAVVDNTAPVISALTSSSITTTAASIAWTTDEDSDTQVEFGPTSAYGQSSAVDATMTKAHAVNLSGLASSTTYHFRVKSRDAAGNLAAGPDRFFITGYAISNLGGVSRSTDGSGSIAVGYGRIQPAAGSTRPSGLGVFGFRQAGVLVSEAGVPATAPITSGRTYAEVSANLLVNTGVAMANPNPLDATVNFELRNSAGTVFRSGSFVLTGTATTCAPSATTLCNQMAKFLNEAPFLSGAGIQGTFSFTSTLPVAVVALRGFFNERTPSEFLITTLPVLDLSAPVGSGTQVVPHFAAGDGWTTQLLLVNPTGITQTGSLQFLDANGAAKTVSIDGQSGSTRSYSVAANSSLKVVVTAASAGLASGSIRVVPTGGGAAPTPLVIFSYKPGAFTVSEAGVPVTMASSFRMYAEQSPASNIRTGLAIANATSTAGTVTLELTGLDGGALASTTQALPASGQLVNFLDNLLPSIATQTFQGVLRITSTASSISVVGLRGTTNERKDFLITTTPPTVETDVPAATEGVFPHLVNGDGYTTQVILFSGTAGQTPAGTLTFLQQTGAPMEINIR